MNIGVKTTIKPKSNKNSCYQTNSNFIRMKQKQREIVTITFQFNKILPTFSSQQNIKTDYLKKESSINPQ
jgi:hypothetical protein